MDELAKVVHDAYFDWVHSDPIMRAGRDDSITNAVRTYLESAVEEAWREGFETADRAGRRSDRMLTTDGFWERSKARAALQAAGGKQDG